MNGVHDMGGMHGMGPIEHETDEPVFHTRGEARAFALTRAMGAWGKWNIDASRHSREVIPAAEYLRMSYYEKWYTGLVDLVVKSGLVTPVELETGKRAKGSPKATPPLTAAMIAPLAKKWNADVARDVPIAPTFKVGQRVRARNINPPGHTRLPRYARGKSGTVRRVQSTHNFDKLMRYSALAYDETPGQPGGRA